jgi:hypothetical protein
LYKIPIPEGLVYETGFRGLDSLRVLGLYRCPIIGGPEVIFGGHRREYILADLEKMKWFDIVKRVPIDLYGYD